MGLLNIRAMRNKLTFIAESLKEFHLDFLCLTETWLCPSDIDVIKAALPESYSLFHVPRLSGMGGGIALIYSVAISNIKPVSSDIEASSFELMEVCFSWHQQTFKLALVYRPGHSGTDRAFMEEFGFFLESLLARPEKLIICGDFNYWVDNPASKPFSAEFVELLDLNNLYNHVSMPTHMSGHTLDLVLTPTCSGCVRNVESVPIDHTVSDHALIVFDVDVDKPSSYTKWITFRNYKNINQRKIVEEIQSGLNGVDKAHMSADQLVAFYCNFFHSMQDMFFPMVTKEIRIKEDGPWYNQTIAMLRRQRRKAERMWRRLKTEDARSKYVSARKAVVDQVSHCKVDYYKNQLELCDGDQKRTYSFLNNLLGRNSAPVLPSSVSDTSLALDFSKFFMSKIIRIRAEIESTPVDQDFSLEFASHISVTTRFSEFKQICEEDVLRHIRELNKTNCELDPIIVSKVGVVYESAAPFIVEIINKCFSESVFVLSEKRALIRPYFKKIGLDRDNLLNYRPVSNLSYLSKIIERTMLDQMFPFLEQSGVISRYQSAYRKCHSTETALCKIYNDLVTKVCSGKTTVLVLLDLSAAFDTVDHQLLLGDLANYGMEGSALLLLQSYLSDRTQRVVVGEAASEPTILQCGVPQGSVLGPILFIVYTSGLVSLLNAHEVDYHFYADDTQLYIEIGNIQDTKDKISALLSDIKKWMCERKLKLNDSKTEVVLIRGNLRNSVVDEFGNLDFEGSQLDPHLFVKNLGIIFDSSLSFRNHINSVVKACNFHIRNLYAIRKYLNKQSLLALVYSLIVPRVDYCNSLFIGLPNCVLMKLQSVLNRATRLIFALPPRVPTTSYLIELHWLPIKARVEFKICLLTFKALKFRQPSYLVELLNPLVAETNVALRSSDDPFRLHEPRATGERAFAARSFGYMAPRLYNKLPVALKQLDSVECFKKHLKTFFFSCAYDIAHRRVTDDYRM